MLDTDWLSGCDHVLNIYILTRLASSGTSNYRPAWDLAKINTLNLVPLSLGLQVNVTARSC